MNLPGNIAVIGSGTWATALAKIVLMKNEHLNWFIRKTEVIDEFYELGHNPSYLPNVKFDLTKISFSSNIERTVKESDTIIIAVPSPYSETTMLSNGTIPFTAETTNLFLKVLAFSFFRCCFK